MAMELNHLPPAPTADAPVTVSFELSPEWLAFHDLEVIGWDEKCGGMLVRKKTNNMIPAPTTTEAL